MTVPAPAWLEAVGLCSVCRHRQVQEAQSGSRFWRCRRAATDPRFARYPPLPVRRCPGFEAAPGAPPPDAG